ncbi:acetyltransferase [Cupriavidus necator N-1]|jgi:putative acetyltransferase|uniref:Acetyltransferase n=1 Tax=Cupriavidus necator (strain ATCC 43291 / DSM 13513 / CCUG 52238 / LMG 8453 / N-1) TaxID=1042878 RepID=F8GN25_CUPNN|nr:MULTISPECIES: N-acetyltransferase [Cupriavidus]AEI80213.1 acetyltransferase [Cupriavidus necator N-1]KAI3596635.1 Acetyltransferase, GNAT family [Cupriavidus necator H850]MDX6010156.1 N-acetyltransferase [Cupriavidus necator]QUN30421.1 N-acetyltransferase [Cupriavidus sp. KK10]
MSVQIRPESPSDADAIAQLTTAAFLTAPHTSHTEAFVVNALRRAGQLTVSLVAQAGDRLVGHVAISPVTVSSGATGWYGLGPISVAPDLQGQGIGSQLMHAALADLRRLGAAGCVLLGDPAYYGRFGFAARPGLVLDGVPPEYFQALAFDDGYPAGSVQYHDAFNATA